jgi:hypothetical protein
MASTRLWRTRNQAIMKRSGHEFSPKPGDDRTVLLRVFCTFYGTRVVLLLHGLNKGEDNSSRRQQREIGAAPGLLKKFKAEQLKAQREAKKQEAHAVRQARRRGRPRR